MPIDHITYQSPEALLPRASNPRTHSKKQIRQIAASIETFGFVNPVLVDRNGGSVVGYCRVAAAKQLGLKSVPTICLETLTEAEVRADVLTDNRLAELAGWNNELLAIELQGLSDLDLDFDVTVKPGATAPVSEARAISRPCNATATPPRSWPTAQALTAKG